jgi:hypothetical protein
MAVKKAATTTVQQPAAPITVNKTVSVLSVIDVISALSDGTLSKNIYLYDNNKAGGSTGQGTSALASNVTQGDTLVWTTMAIEPEVFVEIASITMDPTYCKPIKGFYPGTDVAFWSGVVLKDIGTLQYEVGYTVGTRDGGFKWKLNLAGNSTTNQH